MAPAGTATKALAIICYALALLGSAAFALLVLALGLGLLNESPRLPQPWPWVVDGAWLLAWGVQHSLMPRAAAKRVWEARLPPGLRRSVYAALAGLLLLGLALTWQPVGGGRLWELPRGLVVVPLVAALGTALLNYRFDHAGLFGLRQAWAGGESAPDVLWVEGPYRFLRHPLMACVLVFLWAQPVMSRTLALLAGGMTVYGALGLMLEERDLLRTFSRAYADYRRRVPALLPWRRPVAACRLSPGQALREEDTKPKAAKAI
jgi:protein-S-isoprenylcysteine O-methyltransferase Ste14